jgi:hypothetical protein
MAAGVLNLADWDKGFEYMAPGLYLMGLTEKKAMSIIAEDIIGQQLAKVDQFIDKGLVNVVAGLAGVRPDGPEIASVAQHLDAATDELLRALQGLAPLVIGRIISRRKKA